MRTRVVLMTRLLGILLLSALLLASWAGSMSLPHDRILWRVCEVILLTLLTLSTIGSWRRRRAHQQRVQA